MANSQLARQIAQNQQLAATTQQALRSSRRVIRHPVNAINTAERGDRAEPVVEAPVSMTEPEVQMAIQSPITVTSAVMEIAPKQVSNVVSLPNTSITVSPLDLPTEHFSAGLDRRKQNRQLLMQWLRTSLVDGVDFGRIHIAGKDRCQLARMGRIHDCMEQGHWSKPVLFKPGAEKITGMLGMTVCYPSLPAYEHAALSQVTVTTIVMRCELKDAHGHVVAEGIGARNVSQDYGDVNKTFKMVEKSALIDATLRLAGLSEMFTQDLEDKPTLDANEGGFEAPREAFQPTPAVAKPVAPSPEPSRRVVRTKTVTANTTVPPSSTSPPVSDADIQNVLVTRSDLTVLRKAISKHGFTERRVLSWVIKFTQGAVTSFEQLPAALCTSLLRRLEHWAEAEFFQSTGARSTAEQGE